LAKAGSSEGGKLSTTYQPKSSREWADLYLG
jgi:hypothetical protein